MISVAKWPLKVPLQLADTLLAKGHRGSHKIVMQLQLPLPFTSLRVKCASLNVEAIIVVTFSIYQSPALVLFNRKTSEQL